MISKYKKMKIAQQHTEQARKNMSIAKQKRDKIIMRAKQKEQQIQKSITDYLKLNGWYTFKINNVGIKKTNGKYIPAQTKGICDVIAIKKGKVWFLEIKTKTGKLSEFQHEFGAEIISHLGNYAVLRSLDDAIKLNECRFKGERNKNM